MCHAAAYQHVPLTEQHDACEAIQNNVLGTLLVAEAAMAQGVEKFVMVSTDKGGSPRSFASLVDHVLKLPNSLKNLSKVRYTAKNHPGHRMVVTPECIHHLGCRRDRK